MTPRSLPLLVSLLLPLAACGGRKESADPQREWLSVLRHKPAAAAPRDEQSLSPEAQQQYIDALAQFLARYPDHGRAQEVYVEAELEFARRLSEAGRGGEAVPYYRDYLRTHPDAEAVRKELAFAVDHQEVDRADLAAVSKGMTPHEVTALLGAPRSDWRKTLTKGGRRIDCWYYPAPGGTAAGVFFSNGKVFATDLAAGAAPATTGPAAAGSGK